MTLVALVIAATSVTMMSFGIIGNEVNQADDLVWFKVINNEIQTDQEEPGGPSGSCTIADNDVTCLAAFERSELDPNGHAPTDDPNDPRVADLAYSPEEPSLN